MKVMEQYYTDNGYLYFRSTWHLEVNKNGVVEGLTLLGSSSIDAYLIEYEYSRSIAQSWEII